ncbi:hypothetical protein [Nocardia brasiliensis]|uniref:hypothetical protein n=1 Tax=Nocardia brasiliensis TaxID=37326 RepID=UPI00366FD874
MSEDSKQLSVAELLARNGQQGASPAGGGRRRRGGRGISVAELTGDMPAIGSGHSSHAAPDPGVPDEPVYETPAYEPPAPEPVSYTPPAPAPEPSSYSPMSGPISMYDPLAAYAQPEPQADPLPGRSNRVMPGREMPDSRHGAPADPLSPRTPVTDLYAPSPNPYAPSPNPYAPSPNPYASDPEPSAAAPRSGRRRRYTEPDEETTEVRPLREIGKPERNGATGGRAARRRAAEAEAEAEEAAPATAAWSPSATDFEPEPPPESRATAPWPPTPEPPPEPQRRSAQRNGAPDGGLPAWSARRRKPDAPQRNDAPPESAGISTAAWSLASQDQQLVSGQTVAGDLLRDGVERAERAGAERAAERAGRGKRGRSKGDAGHAPVDELDLYDGKTDYFEPIDLDAEDDEHEPLDEDEQADHDMSPRRSRVARKAEYDANRRQWLILGGQSTGAAVAGMLLFKGFERMWEMLPWVALTLAMIVILGLVALVRILRRTDDVLSTVIAVVVGVFVTLGPLAFLLSTD